MPTLQVDLRSPGPIALNAQFSCRPGELVALLGASGSGKTSMLRAIAGLLPARTLQGSVQLGDEVWFDSARGIHRPPQDRTVGLVFQSYALFPHLSAIENVAVSVVSTGSKANYLAKAKELLERLGLGGLEHRLPAELSGGQQQRVALARALLRLQDLEQGQSRGVLLLDEPFSAVDTPTRQTLYRELAALREHLSTPMVLVTHDLFEARRLADAVVVVDAGVTLQCGAPAKVFAQPRNARVAHLVGIQNIFYGRFQRATSGQATLEWLPTPGASDDAITHTKAQNLTLRILDKGRIDDGVNVNWVLSGEATDVRPWDSDITRVACEMSHNCLKCVLDEVLSLGETSLCTLRPAGTGQQMSLVLSTAYMRQVLLGAGSTVALLFPVEAIHIMPLRS